MEPAPACNGYILTQIEVETTPHGLLVQNRFSRIYDGRIFSADDRLFVQTGLYVLGRPYTYSRYLEPLFVQAWPCTKSGRGVAAPALAVTETPLRATNLP